MADHAEALLLRAGQEARRVHEHHERQPVRVAGAHELGCLLGGGGVDHTAQVPGLVCDNSDGAAVDPAERGDHVARPARRHLEQLGVVHERADHVANVVDLAGRLRHVRGRVERRHRRGHAVRRALAGVLGQVSKQLARDAHGLVVVRRHELADAVLGVHLRAAELLRVHVLAGDLAHDARAGEEHRRALRHHDEVGERRRVGAAARGDAGDDRDLRHLAGQPDALAEDPSVAAERGDAVVHARAAGGDEADHGRAGAAGELHHAHDRLGVRLAQRAAGEGLVLRVAVHRPARDRARGADHAVALAHALRLAPRQHGRANHVQRSRIAEQLESVTRGDLTLLFQQR